MLRSSDARAESADERLQQLERKAAELARQRAQLAQRGELVRAAMTASEQTIAQKRARLAQRENAAERAALERTLAAAREQALTLRGLEAEMKQLDALKRAIDRERASLYDASVDRLEAELERLGSKLDGRELKRRLARLAELRRARDSLALPSPAASAHRGSDLDSIVATPGDSPETLLEKADLVASFARAWRKEREDVLHRLAQARSELAVVRRLAAMMEERRRGRLTTTDPFAADVEAFALHDQEAEISSRITALHERSKELAGWIERARRRQEELTPTTRRPEP